MNNEPRKPADSEKGITSLRNGSDLLDELYEDLRKLARSKLSQEKPGQTLQATALVHEAWMRLSPDGDGGQWENSRHFYGAAAESMRRILIDQARRKNAHRHGGDHQRTDLNESRIESPATAKTDKIVALDEALEKLAVSDSATAELINLRYFVGLSIADTAEVLDVSQRTVKRNWAYAKAWIQRELQKESSP
jgi:RNA polymerase sigma factor (TIGR02999 family)